MTLGEKIYKLRSELSLSQEAFGDRLGVSRQSVSKWETDQSLPELEKIVAMSRLFGVSTDYLLKEDAYSEQSYTEETENTEAAFSMRRPHYEYKSRKTIKGLPLVHIHFGFGFYRARGIFAIGNRAEGVVAIGFLSAGIVSVGLLSAGVLALGTIAAGLVALGSLAVGCIAFGAFSVGIFCIGACNFGEFCYGALSYGRQVAIGDEAHGRIAIGLSRAAGEVYEEVIGKDYQFDYPAIEKIIDENVSSNWFIFRSWIKGILRMLAH